LPRLRRPRLWHHGGLRGQRPDPSRPGRADRRSHL